MIEFEEKINKIEFVQEEKFKEMDLFFDSV